MDGDDAASTETKALLLTSGALQLLARHLGPFLHARIGAFEERLPSYYESEADPAAQLWIIQELWRSSHVGVEERLARSARPLARIRNASAHHSLRPGDDERALALVESMLREIGHSEAALEIGQLRAQTENLLQSPGIARAMQGELAHMKEQLEASRSERDGLQAEHDRLLTRLNELGAASRMSTTTGSELAPEIGVSASQAQDTSPAAMRETLASVTEQIADVDRSQAQRQSVLEARLSALLGRLEQMEGMEQERVVVPPPATRPPWPVPRPASAPPSPSLAIQEGPDGAGSGPARSPLRQDRRRVAALAFGLVALVVITGSVVAMAIASRVGRASSTPTATSATTSSPAGNIATAGPGSASTQAATTSPASSAASTPPPTATAAPPRASTTASLAASATAPPATTPLVVINAPPPATPSPTSPPTTTPAFNAELRALLDNAADAERARLTYLANRDASYQQLLSETSGHGYIDQAAEAAWLARDAQLEWDLQHSDYPAQVEQISNTVTTTPEVVELRRQLVDYFTIYLTLHESARFAAEDWADYYQFTGPEYESRGVVGFRGSTVR